MQTFANWLKAIAKFCNEVATFLRYPSGNGSKEFANWLQKFANKRKTFARFCKLLENNANYFSDLLQNITNYELVANILQTDCKYFAISLVKRLQHFCKIVAYFLQNHSNLQRFCKLVANVLQKRFFLTLSHRNLTKNHVFVCVLQNFCTRFTRSNANILLNFMHYFMHKFCIIPCKTLAHFLQNLVFSAFWLDGKLSK